MARHRKTKGQRTAQPSKSSLTELKRQVSEAQQEIKRARRKELIALGILVALLILGAYLIGSGITGFLVSGNATSTYSDTLSATFIESSEYAWVPAEPGELTRVAISGRMLGSGTAKVYLNDKLVYDSAAETAGIEVITGYQVLDEQAAEESEPISEEQSVEEIPIELPTEELPVEELVEESPTEETPIEETPIEEPPAETPLEEEPAEVPQEELVEVPTAEETPSEIPGEIPVEETPIEETPTEEIPVETPIEEAQVEEQPAEESPIEELPIEPILITFEDECIDTCLLDGLNETSYTIRVELENATLELDSITYTIKAAEPLENQPPVFVFEGSLEISADAITELNLSDFFSDADGDLLTCVALPGESLFAASDSNIITLAPDSGFVGATTLQLYVSDGVETVISPIITVNVVQAPSVNITPIPAEGPAPQNLTQFTAEIGKPVRWQKLVRVENPTNETLAVNVSTELPSAAEDITIYNKADEKQISKELIRLSKQDKTLAEYETIKSAEQLEKESKKAQEKKEEKQPEKLPKDITFEDEILPGAANEYTVEYYTEAPQIAEEPTKSGKKITVSSETGYTDILTYADIAEVSASKLRLYWYASREDYARYILGDGVLADTLAEESYKVDITSNPLFGVNLVDSDENGQVDRIEWLTPHLSNQTFEISLVVLNPYTYLRDGETWTVAFNTSGMANLTISSPNAGWTEFLLDDTETFDEMRFLDLKCGEESLASSLKLIGFDNSSYDYSAVLENDTIDIQKLLIADYECNSTGYLSNYMLKAGYATLMFEFADENATVTDYAYDPDAPVMNLSNITSSQYPVYSNSTLMGWCNATDVDGDNVSYDVKWYVNDKLYEEVIPEYIDAGDYHTCGVLFNGSAMCWGKNSYGQIGNVGAITRVVNPTAVNSNGKFKSISAGGSHTCGVLFNGSALCWGSLQYGQIGNGSESYYGYIVNPTAVNSSGKFKSISAGSDHTCGVLINGSALCWGYNSNGKIGNGSSGGSALNPTYVNSSEKFKSISAGDEHTCGILVNGSAICWGDAMYYQIGNGGATDQSSPTLVKTNLLFKSISAGSIHTCGVLVNGSAMCWGSNAWGQLGIGSSGGSASSPIRVQSSAFKSISAGYQHTCGVLINGSALCWGGNGYGQLGYGGTAQQNNPIAVNTSSLFKSISTGYYHTCGVLFNGSVLCWGYNSDGQIGNGSFSSSVYAKNPTAVNSSLRMWPFYNPSLRVNVANLTYGMSAYQNWTLECRASDYWGYSDYMNSSPIIIENTAPVVYTPTITPPDPDMRSNLTCYAIAWDLDNTSLEVEWWWHNWSGSEYKEVLSGNTSVIRGQYSEITTLGSGNISLGETWKCTVRSFDGWDYSDQDFSVINIVNATPTISTPIIMPELPTSFSNLVCNATPEDLENETLEVEWWWYNLTDGGYVEFSHGNTTGLQKEISHEIITLGSGNLSRHDVWNCTVRAYDGTNYSEYTSAAVTILSVPPVMNLSNITSNQYPVYSNSTLMAWCNATDIESDSVSYDVRWYLNSQLYEEIIPEYISTGYFHTCGLLMNGSAVCWGDNGNGELGYGGTGQQNNPVAVNSSSLFRSISAGGSHTCGILVNGSAVCWGYGTNGRLGYGGTDDRYIPTAVNSSSLFKSISSGSTYTCGILVNGSAMCWGRGYYGQLGNGGTDDRYTPTAVNISSLFKSISSGSTHTCGVLVNGSAVCWGYGTYGRLGYGGADQQNNPVFVNTSSLFKSISAADYETTSGQTCGLLINGSAMCWGSATALGYGGTNFQYNPIAVNTSSLFKNIDTGSIHTCGVLINGSAMCWGSNSGGQLGDGSTTYKYNPTPVNTSSLFKSISAGGASTSGHSCGVLMNGSGLCWGYNRYGQIGNGSSSLTVYALNPTAVNSSERMWPFYNQSLLVNVANLTGSMSAFQNWTLECRASDYWLYSDYLNSTAITIENSAPSATPMFQPQVPDIRSNLSCKVIASDLDNTSLEVEWKLYNYSGTGFVEVLSGNTSVIRNENTILNTLGSDNISFGETWNCTVRAFDGWLYSEYRSAIVTIGNATPTITNLIVTPLEPTITTNLVCNATPEDLENSTLDVEWWWYNLTDEGYVVVFHGNTTGLEKEISHEITTLGSGNLTVGDEWKCTVRAYDGYNYSEYASASVTILNSRPVINYSAITSSQGILYSYSTMLGWCNATDSNGDMVSYDISWYLNDQLYEEVIPEYISAQRERTCGILNNGSAMCWGYNYYGQLGDGTLSSRLNPVAVNTSSLFKSITGGDDHTCGLLVNGSAVCWGSNSLGQIGNGTNGTNVLNPRRVNTSGKFKSISAGSDYTCGLLVNGSALCWGDNRYGQIGNGTNGTFSLNPTLVNTNELFKSISAGNGHACGILVNGSAVCWGSNSLGQIGNGTSGGNALNLTAVNTTDLFKSISAGGAHTCGILVNGSAVCWGYNSDGQIGNGSFSSSVYAKNPTAVNSSSLFKSISAGSGHTCGILLNGSALCWGSNNFGQLGFGDWNDKYNPISVNTTGLFKSISAGSWHTCGVLLNGSVLCSGENDFGALGDGSSNQQKNPVAVNTSEMMWPFYNQSTLMNLANITYGLEVGQNWTLECRASDYWSYSDYHNSTTITVKVNTVPNITTPIIMPLIPSTSYDLACNSTATDQESTSLAVEWYWYNWTGSAFVEVFSSNKSVENGTNSLITTLGAGNTSAGETWNCTVRAFDGVFYSDYNSAAVTIENTPPVVAGVVLSSTLGTNTTTENLTVYFSQSDADGNAVTNITDWRKSGVSIAVLNLPFNTNTTTTSSGGIRDYSSYANNCTMTGPADWTASGKVGGAYSFDGTNDYITCPNSIITNANTATISFWMYPTDVTTRRYIWAYDNSDLPEVRIFLETGNLNFMGYDNSAYQWQLQKAVSINTWYHVVGVWRDGYAALYVNATRESYDESVAITHSTTATDNFGYYARDGAGSKYQGILDEMHIYNYSLSEQQILAIYAAESQGKAPNKIVSQELLIGQNWTVAVTPNDKYDDGTTVLSNPLIIINSAPTLTGPSIFPQSPTIASDLECNVTANDLENESLEVEWYWYKNSVLNLSGNSSAISGENTQITTLGSGNLTIGDEWNCTVRAFDGSLYSGYNSSKVTIQNLPPVMALSNITSTDSFKTTSTILGWCNATDGDLDNVTYSWKWFVNGAVNTTGSESSFNGWCYQETANVSTACGGVDTGEYYIDYYLHHPIEAIDGNWSTNVTYLDSSGPEIRVNYTKPENALFPSLWSLKNDLNGTYNISIPEECFSQDPIQFYINMDGSGGDIWSRCFNGSSWITIDYNLATNFYEEAMWWNISTTTTTNHTSGSLVNVANISSSSLEVGQNWTLECTAYDGTNYSAALNSSNVTIIESYTTDYLPLSDTSVEKAMVVWISDDEPYMLNRYMPRYAITNNSGQSWSTSFITKNLNNYSEESYMHNPSLALNKEGNGVMCGRRGDNDWYLFQWDYNASLGKWVDLDGGSLFYSFFFSTCAIDIYNDNSILLAPGSGSGYAPYYSYSTNAGKTWTTWAETNSTYDYPDLYRIPSMTYLDDGTALTVFKNDNSPYGYMYYAWNGSRWNRAGITVETNTSNTSSGFYSSGELAAYPGGGAYFIWSDDDATGDPIFVRKWDGSSWGESTLLDSSSNYINYNKPSISCGSSGSCMAVWPDTGYDLEYSYYNGTNWSAANVNIGTSIDIDSQSKFSVAVDSIGNAIVCYKDDDNSDLYSIVYNQTAKSWQAPNLISTDVNIYTTSPDTGCKIKLFASDQELVMPANSPPTLGSISDSLENLLKGQNQTITAVTIGDSDTDTLHLTCCKDTTNTCTPTLRSNNCTGGNYLNRDSPYSLNCTYPAGNKGTEYIRCALFDLENYSTISSESYTVENTPPTPPPVLNLNSTIHVGEELTATALRAGDNDSDTITYYYEFYNINHSAIRQSLSTDNTYIIDSSDGWDVLRVRAWAYDGLNYSASYIEKNITPTYLPVMNNATILPAEPTLADTLIGYCTASDQDGDNVTYGWKWYRNDNEFASGGYFDQIVDCYQEFANESTECGGLGTGTYISTPIKNLSMIDGNWSSYGQASGKDLGIFQGYYINYSKPIGATNDSLWQIKDEGGMLNLTINSTCWNYDPSKLSVQIMSASGLCLSGDTLVSTPGGEIPIKNLEEGQTIYSYNPLTGKVETDVVNKVIKTNISLLDNPFYNITYLTSSGNNSVLSTFNHRFYTNSSYLMAKDLKKGDVLINIDLSEAEIIDINKVYRNNEITWDIIVENNSNFFANNILVHNLEYGAGWYCWNGSWVTMRENTSSINIYEEAMIWKLPSTNFTYYPEGVEVNVANISSSNLSEGDIWKLSCMANDMTGSSTWLNSSTVTIQNSAPTQGTPYITPSSPNTTSNLTCNWNSTYDADNDPVQNITVWYKNSLPLMGLYLPFEGGSDSGYTKDYSGYGNHGTVYNSTWNRTGGQVGGAYELDGEGDIIVVNNTASLNPSQLTLMAWVYVNEIDLPILYKPYTAYSPPYYQYGFQTGGTGTLIFDIAVGGTRYDLIGGVLSTGTWYHMAGTYDGDIQKIYINGKLNASDADPSGALSAYSTNLMIGTNQVAPTSFFNGSIDEVKIYNISLTPDQIYQEYLAGSQNRQSNLIVSDHTNKDDGWYCQVTPNDGDVDGNTLNSSTVFIQNMVPEMKLSNITSTDSFKETSTLLGWCQATDSDAENVTYSWKWFMNGESNATGNETSLEGWCYQETANVSTACGGLSTGSYYNDSIWQSDVTSVYDGNWSTAAAGGLIISGSGRLYINYSKPSSATGNSLWQIKDAFNNMINLSLPNSCYNSFDDKIALEVYSMHTSQGKTNITWFCYNSTGSWLTLISSNCTECGLSGVYEEAMWWNISGSSTTHTSGSLVNVANISSSSLEVGQNWTLECTAYDGTNYSAPLNSTPITIINSLPTVTGVILNSTFGTNTTVENLTIYFSQSDADGDSVTNITDWRLNGQSIAVLNMPFDTNISSTSSGAVKDYSTYGNNGTLHGPTWTSAGKLGGGYVFDGNDYIDISNSGLLNTNETYAISLWFKVDEGNAGALIAKDDPGTYVQYYIGWYGGQFKFYYAPAYHGMGDIRYPAWDSIDTVNWHHVAAGWNGTAYYLYADGQYINATPSTTNYAYTDARNSIGRYGGYNGYYFVGKIDEVKIYNISLSSAQILSEYNEGLANHSVQIRRSSELAVGQNWTVAVTPNDRYGDGTTVISNQLLISNSLPNITGPSISPALPNITSTLNCTAIPGDLENTSLIIEYWWYNGSSLKFSGNTTATKNTNTQVALVGAGNLSDGDTWNCTVRTFDGWNYSAFNSSKVTIQNMPPVMRLSNITSTDSFKTTSTLLGWCNATDGDLDNVTYSWKWFLDGEVNETGSESSFNGWCYQETANVSTACGGLDTGSYSTDYFSVEYITDGDWSTQVGGGGGHYSFYINYSIPSAITAYWQIKAQAPPDYYNYVEVYCYNYTSSSYIPLYYFTGDIPNTTNVSIPGECLLNNKFIGKISFYSADGDAKLYEEAMWWYIEGDSHSSGSLVNVANITSDNLVVGQNWTLECTAYDGTNYSAALNSTKVTIQNTLPTKVILKQPTNHNDTLLNRTPVFIWYNATDIDNDILTYNISITHPVYADINASGISATYYAPLSDLQLDTSYNWSVQACDPVGCGPWSDSWNFSIMSVSIILVNGTAEFGTLQIGNERDTTNDSDPLAAKPFVIENNGNVNVNISVYAQNNQPLWTVSYAGLNTSYYQSKADNTSEQSSFDWARSLTDWASIQNETYKISHIINLSYIDTKDTAQVDIKIRVPSSEPSGTKTSVLVFEAGATT